MVLSTNVIKEKKANISRYQFLSRQPVKALGERKYIKHYHSWLHILKTTGKN